MAKTLIYAAGSPTSVKLGDTDTNLYLQVAKDNVAIDLTSVTSITVKIADANKNYLKDISIAPANLTSGNNGILTVPLNSDNVGGLNSGDYYFEVWIITADSETEIYPDMNVTRFHVFNNLVGGTAILTTLTMQAFLDRITANQTASETSLNNSQTALANANTANTNAAKVLSDLNAGNYLTKDTLSNAPSFETLQTQVNNSAVGTNLLTNSNFTSLKNWIITTGTNADGKAVATTDSDGDTCIHITGTGIGCGVWSTPVSFNQNQVTTGSALVKGTGTLSSIGLESRTSSNFGTISTESYSKVGSTAQASSSTNNFTIYFSPVNDVIDIYVKFAKLELGSHATDWYPNPSEILTQTDYAKIKAAIVALGGSLS